MRRFTISAAMMMGVALAFGSATAQARASSKDHPVRSYHIPTYKGKQHIASKSGLLDPQPLAPRATILSNKVNWGALNPQPLPPKVGAMTFR